MWIHQHTVVDVVSSAPILFYKPQTSLIGPEATINVPKAAQPVDKHLPDYEVELTVVIGKPCKDVSEAEALDYVLGYCTGNDVSEFTSRTLGLKSTLLLLFVLDVIPVPPDGYLAMGLL